MPGMQGSPPSALWHNLRKHQRDKHIKKLERKRRRMMATFENYNGETKTRASEGAIVGSITGLIMGIFFCVMIYQSYAASGAYLLFIFMLTIFGSVAAFTFAGILVGIGIPRFNPNPSQGWLNRWRQVMRTNRSLARRTEVGRISKALKK